MPWRNKKDRPQPIKVEVQRLEVDENTSQCIIAITHSGECNYEDSMGNSMQTVDGTMTIVMNFVHNRVLARDQMIEDLVEYYVEAR